MGLFDCWDELLKNQPAWLEVPIDKELYAQAEGVIRELGCTPEDAVRLLLQQFVANADSIKERLSKSGNAQTLLHDVITATKDTIIHSNTAKMTDPVTNGQTDTSSASTLIELKERTFSVTALRKHQNSVFEHIELPGNVAIITRHGVRECAMMSMTTYKHLLDYADALAKHCSQFFNDNKK